MGIDERHTSQLEPMLPDSLQGCYRLGECEFDVDSGTVIRDGQSHRLEPKVAQLLEYLMLRPDRIISKDQLLKDLWQGTPVVDEALHRCLSRLRKVLNDSTRHPRYIETLSKRGYRFLIQPARIESAAPAPDPHPAVMPDLVEHSPPDRGHKVLGLVMGMLLMVLMISGAYWLGVSSKSREQAPASHPANAYVERAVRLLADDPSLAEEAAVLLRRGLAFEPANPFGHSQLALLLASHTAGQSASVLSEMEAAAKTAITLAPEDGYAQLAFAAYLQRTGDTRSADSFLLKAYQQANTEPLFQLQLGEVLLDARAYARAQFIFWQVSNQSRWRDRALRGLNAAYRAIGLEEKVVKSALAVAEFAPFDDETAAASARFLLSRGRADGLHRCHEMGGLQCTLVRADAALLGSRADALALYEAIDTTNTEHWIGDLVALRIAQLQNTQPQGLVDYDNTARGQWVAALHAALLGANDTALDHLDAARLQGWSDWWWDEVEPGFTNLRNNGRFKAHIREMRSDRSADLEMQIDED